MQTVLLCLLLFLFVFFFSSTSQASIEKLLPNIKLPTNFAIQLVAENVSLARQMALNGDESILYVGTLDSRVYAIPLQRAFALPVADNSSSTIIKGTSVLEIIENEPDIPTELSGVEYDTVTDTLFVSTYCCIYKYSNFQANTLKPAKREDFYTEFSQHVWHGRKYLRFTPPINGDRHLLIHQGAPCNICTTLKKQYGKTYLMNLRTKELVLIADGIRNSWGYAFEKNSTNPFAKLFFTENSRDRMGDDDFMPDEINVIENWNEFVVNKNRTVPHYGFPFCDGDDIPDDTFVDPNYKCTKTNPTYVRPYQNVQAHSVPLGLTMYRHPRLNKGKLVALVAEHGGWNRAKPNAGYRIMMLDAESTNPFSDSRKYREFATGFVAPDTSSFDNVWGRPVDVLIMQDNSILISDDRAGAIYRIYDTNPADTTPMPEPEPAYSTLTPQKSTKPVSPNPTNLASPSCTLPAVMISLFMVLVFIF